MNGLEKVKDDQLDNGKLAIPSPSVNFLMSGVIPDSGGNKSGSGMSRTWPLVNLVELGEELQEVSSTPLSSLEC